MVDYASSPQASWSLTDENLAMLIDRLDYWLITEYSKWTTDPDDPEVKQARAKRKREGTKPPPIPVITPVAMRPQEEHERAIENAKALRKLFDPTPDLEPDSVEDTISALDKLLG